MSVNPDSEGDPFPWPFADRGAADGPPFGTWKLIWALKNCFPIVVLEKKFKSPMEYKIKLVNPKSQGEGYIW